MSTNLRLAVCAVAARRRARAGCGVPRGGRLALLRRRRRRHALVGARPDRSRQRRAVSKRSGASAPAISTRCRRRPATWRSRPRRSWWTTCWCSRRRWAACSRSTRRPGPSAGASTPPRRRARCPSSPRAASRAGRTRRRPPGAACRRRIFATTIESRLFAIDAANGRACPDFGREGEVDLREGVGAVHGVGVHDLVAADPGG